jgi:quinol monooxygenase YgiN
LRRVLGYDAVMADVLTVVAKVRAAKGKGDALAALLAEQAAAVRQAEPGCLVYRAHRSAKDPDLFLFYEAYADDAAFDAHRKAPHLAVFRERREREGLIDGPVEVEIYRSLTE